MPDAKTKPPLKHVYRALLKRWGRQNWWPARSRFEMMVGAILTQNTAWTNVERAIRNLKKAKVLTPSAMAVMPEKELAELIRPSGSFNVKARRLKNFLRWLNEKHGGNINRMFIGETKHLRAELLSVNGIGKETADSMLLYAGNHPVFVVDAYTRRVLERHHWISPGASYDDVASLCTKPFSELPETDQVLIFNEFHALIVLLAKKHCRSKPDCDMCPLKRWLP